MSIDFSMADYRESIATDPEEIYNSYSLEYQWLKTPHKHVFDLCRMNDLLQAKLEKLSKRQKADEEAFWEERDARVELQAEVEKLEARLKPLLKFEHATLVSVKNGEDK